MKDTSVDRAIQKALERALQQPVGPCPDHNQLAAYLESRCDAPERLRLQEHLASCGTCQQVLALSLELSESDAVKVSQRSPVPGRLFRFAIPVSALVTAALLLGIVVLWQKKSNQPVNQTAEIRPIPSAPAPAAPQLPPARMEERKVSVPQPAGKAAAQQVQPPARMAKRPELPTVGVPVRTDSALAKTEEVGITSAAAVGKPQPAEETTKLAEPITAKQFREERAAFKAQVTAQNEPAQDQQRASERLQVQGLSQARQMSPAAGVTISKAAPGFVMRPREAIAGFSNASTPSRNELPVRKAGEKVFYQWSGYWIDGECVAHAKAPLAEVTQGSKEYEEAAGQIPTLREFLAAGTPVLLYWNGKIYVIR